MDTSISESERDFLPSVLRHKEFFLILKKY